MITVTVNLFMLYYLFSGKQKLRNSLLKFVIGLFYIGGGCIFLTMIPYKNDVFAKYLIIGIFILIWVNDSFAYLVGKTVGKHRLYPAISPKKTIEGALGGMVFSLGTAYLLSGLEPILNTVQWLVLALVIIVSGTLGDLVESKLKREAGVKDSGAILPGHGGMLDRLDSLIYAAPFAYLTLNLYSHVS